MTCVKWVLQVVNVCTLKDQFLRFSLGTQRWCVCHLPFTIFPFPLPESPVHTRPIVFWYDLSNARLADAHAHAYTEALSVPAALITHWDTLSTFIALQQWSTLSEGEIKKKKSHSLFWPLWPPLHQPQAWTAPCKRVTACLFLSVSHQNL